MGMAGLMLLAFSSSLYAEDVSLLKPHAGTNVTQQASTLKGVVSDDFGPVAGASVVVKGTTNGVMTGMDGSFVLNGVKRGDVIVISYIGFATQEITYTGQTTLNVKMKEDSQQLDEVVVVGFGTQKKVEFDRCSEHGQRRCDRITTCSKCFSSITGGCSRLELFSEYGRRNIGQ